MTDSVTLRIPLSPAAAAACTAAGYGIIKKRKEGQHIEHYREKVMNSPLSRARMTVLFMQADDNPDSLPIAIVADLNLPSALFGQNYIHGCSALAASNAGLKLLKIVLAQQGAPAEELENLSIAQTTLDSVTLTFLYETASQEQADLQMEKLSKSLRKMFAGKARARRRLRCRISLCRAQGMPMSIFRTSRIARRYFENASTGRAAPLMTEC